jgi:hypothetical protein
MERVISLLGGSTPDLRLGLVDRLDEAPIIVKIGEWRSQVLGVSLLDRLDFVLDEFVNLHDERFEMVRDGKLLLYRVHARVIRHTKNATQSHALSLFVIGFDLSAPRDYLVALPFLSRGFDGLACRGQYHSGGCYGSRVGLAALP